MGNFLRSAEHWIAQVLSQEWAWRILIGLFVVAIGSWLARTLSRVLDRLMHQFAVDEILRNFLRNLAYAVFLVIIIVAALDFAGVPTTSLLAVVGAAGLGIGLALKDSLSNFASGVMLILLRPFHAGDAVQIAGLEGVVENVRIFQTRMHTADNREIILPNSQITSSPIVNYTARGERRIEIPLAMAFGDDLKGLRENLLSIATSHPKVKAKPAPEVLVTAVGEASVAVLLRAWVRAHDHAAVHSELLETILGDFSQRRARFPLPAPVNLPRPAGP